jgi:hypothetical protein
MFEKVVTWLKVGRPKPQDEPADAEMKELAELIENGNPEDAEVLTAWRSCWGRRISRRRVSFQFELR